MGGFTVWGGGRGGVNGASYRWTKGTGTLRGAFRGIPIGTVRGLSAPKSRDSLRLRRRFLPLPPQNRAIFKAPRCAISSAKKVASERRFSLRFKGTNLIPTAEFPAIPESAAKIASERRCAILVHSLRGMIRGTITHRNRSDFCDLRLRCPSRTPEIAQFPKQEKAMLHCDLRVRWKVASDLRFRAAISEPKTPSFCGISGDLAQSTRKSLAIAIVRFWCAK